MPADQLAVDLVGALPDLGDLGVAHQPFDPVVTDVAVAAVQLHRLLRDAHREVGGAQLQHRGLDAEVGGAGLENRSEEHTSELQSLMRISYAVFCLKKQNKTLPT